MKKKIFAIIILLISFITYALTTSPYLQAGDSAEMTAVTITLGVPHQPSYPLYTVLTHAIIKLPIPYLPETLKIKPLTYSLKDTSSHYTEIYKAGLGSALFQSLANVFVFLLLIELASIIKKQHQKNLFIYITALLITGIYAFSETIWLYATKPEVFALNNLFAAVILYLAFRWYNNNTKSKVSVRYLLLLGLAFSHHQTIILIFPALLVIYLLKVQEIGNAKFFEPIRKFIYWEFADKFNKLFPYVFMFILGVIPFFIVLWTLSQRYPLINWGEISSPVGLVRALIRADYGSIGAYLTNIESSTVPADQIPFFVEQLHTDFSFFILIIAFIGIVAIYRINKKISIVSGVLLLVAGPIFLMYANFGLESDFSRATVTRFYMLPEMIIMMYIFYAAIALYNITQNISGERVVGLEIKTISRVFILTVIISLLVQSSSNNKPNYDDLTYQYAKISLKNTEENAMLMVTGDIPNMTAQYMQAVEGEKKSRTIFSPGQFHLKWFQKQLKKRYPNLEVPSPLPGKQFTSPLQVIKANFHKQPIYISPEFIEINPEIQKEYVLWPKGLLLKVEEKGKEYQLEKYIEENNNIYKSIKMSDIVTLRNKKNQLESPLIAYYARHFYNLGAVFNSVHKYQDALNYFNYSLEIDPTFADSYKAIGTIYYFTEDYEQRDPESAYDAFSRYLQFSKTLSADEYQTIQNALAKIQEDTKKAQEEQQKLYEEELKKQASSSAESSASAQQNKENTPEEEKK